MKTRYILYPLLMLLAMLLPTSCSFEEDVFDAPAADGNKISFTMDVSLVGASNVESRAFGETDFSKIESLHIAVFEETEDGSYFREFLDNDDITLLSENDGHGCWKFNVTITKASAATGKKYRLHLIANYPGLTMGFGEEGQLMGLLETQANDKDVYWNFVELTSISESSVISLQHVPLVRNYVQIKIDANSNFTGLTNVQYALYYVPTKGRVAAYNTNPEATSKFANFVKVKEDDTIGCQDYDNLLGTQKYAGNEAYDDGTLLSNKIDELDWKDITAVTDDTDGSVSYNSTISYMYERNHSQRVNPTCMLIRGTYNGSTSYYKLDFVDGNGDYYNLLRNFIYTMNVTEVKGPGYETAEKALNHPAGNNISGDTKTASYTNVSDGTRQLYVSTTSILFTQKQSVNLYFKYIPNISAPTTTSNDAVTISGTTGNVLASVSDVVDVNMGQYAGWSRITLNPKDIPAIAASQELTFTAGGLKRTVKLQSQLPYSGMTVTAELNSATTDENDVLVNIKLPVGIPETLFPLRLFIRTYDNTIFPAYGDDMPAESQNGKYGFIKEISWKEYKNNETKELICNFLTNCDDYATYVYVENPYINTARGELRSTEAWDKSVTLTANKLSVSIEQIYGRYPQRIHNNNNATESVTVKWDGWENNQTITINRNSVTSANSITFTDNNGLFQSDEVVFEFTDNYWHGINSTGQDQWSSITYRATSTLREIKSGTTLCFRPVGEINKIINLILTKANFIGVSLQQQSYTSGGYMGYGETTYNVYPFNIHNGTNYNGQPNNNGEETVDVYYNNEILFKMTINNSQVTKLMNVEGVEITEVNISDSNGIIKLELEFNDKYCTGVSRNNYGQVSYNWSENNATYTATCTVEELLNGATLDFKRQQ